MGLTFSGIESDILKLYLFSSMFYECCVFQCTFQIGLINSLLLLLFVIIEFHLSEIVERRTAYTVIDKIHIFINTN